MQDEARWRVKENKETEKEKRSGVTACNVTPPSTLPMPRPFKQVTVIFGENKLQKTFNLEYDTSADTAQEIGMVEIRKHLDKLERENGMPHIELDPECTDFFPGIRLSRHRHPLQTYADQV